LILDIGRGENKLTFFVIVGGIMFVAGIIKLLVKKSKGAKL